MITGGTCKTALLDFLKGVHQPGDDYRIALYTDGANLSPFTEFYDTYGEVQGKGYTAGGISLQGLKFAMDGVSACMGWTYDPVWKNATIAADGALIYNRSRDNKAVVVLKFNTRVTSTNGNYRVDMLDVTSTTAPIVLE